MATTSLLDLLGELARAHAWTEELLVGLSAEQVAWRPHPDSSGIGWHLGHQAAVAHYMLRNLTAAEARIDPEIEALMDSATPERDRGDLPPLERLREVRSLVAERIDHRIRLIDEGAVGAPNQLRLIAAGLVVALVNHEYQHSTWIGEVRSEAFGLEQPPPPVSPRLQLVDGYVVLVDPA